MFAIIDLETTGGDPKANKITEIAILIHDGEKLINQFLTFVNPQTPIPPLITKITGITDEMVRDAPLFSEVANQVLDLTKDKIIVAHNARFDYSFLKEEFKSLGIRYTRKNLCTVRLSRKLLPGIRSYSLGKLCEHINIPVEQRHRAMGDAAATLKLFELLLSLDQKNFNGELIHGDLSRTYLPPQISLEKMDALPEEAGIYYFHGRDAQILYIGQSRNIQQRIYSHFQNDLNSSRFAELKDKIQDISYELTGSELISLLLEAEEVNHHQPIYNRTRAKNTNRYSIYSSEDENGYIRLQWDSLTHGASQTLTTVSSENSAKNLIHHLAEQFQLCQKLCSLHTEEGSCPLHKKGQCHGACIGIETAEFYNQRALSAIQLFRYSHPNLLILGPGRRASEKSVIRIENHQYYGYGYFENSADHNIMEIKESIRPHLVHIDAVKIIRPYLKKSREDQVMHY